MNFTAYHLLRHTTCCVVAFVPRRIGNAMEDVIVALADTLVPPDVPITFTDYQGNEVTL